MAPDLTAWLDEREREARACESCSWVSDGIQTGPCRCTIAEEHIAAWSPDTALRVLRALRAAQAIFDGGYDETTLGWFGGKNPNHAKVPSRLLDELQAALDALPGAKP